MISPSSAADVSEATESSYLDNKIYLSSSTHPQTSEPIIVFSLASLSSLPESISDDELFEGLLERCTPWVGEEGERGYALVILASEGEVTNRGRGSGFWVWRWRRIPRSFRKNLKRMYIVQPTRFTRTILQVVIPFLSPKSYRKIYPLESILLLHRLHGVSLAGVHLTIPLLQDESRTMADRPDLFPLAHQERYPRSKELPGNWLTGFREAFSAAAGYLPYSSAPLMSPAESSVLEGCYGQSPEDLFNAFGGVPPVMDDLRNVILSECSKTEGIFRGTPGGSLRPSLIALLSLPAASQPVYPWVEIARADPFLPPKLLMRIFSSAPEPCIPSSVYAIIRRIRSASDISSLLFPALSSARIALLSHIIRTFHLLATAHELTTRMTARNYAICFAPDLIRGEDPVEDLEMCLEPGRILPPALASQRKQGGLREQGDSSLVAVLEMWITDIDLVERNPSM